MEKMSKTRHPAASVLDSQNAQIIHIALRWYAKTLQKRGVVGVIEIDGERVLVTEEMVLEVMEKLST